jgi:hypothetical protein
LFIRDRPGRFQSVNFLIIAVLIILGGPAPARAKSAQSANASQNPKATPTEHVRGTVVGPDNKPLPGQTVVLHRVMGSSGITAATSVSDAKGNFVLDVPDASAQPDAVYFLAARYNNELYIGDAFKAPFDTTVQHSVQVGIAATSARALVAGTNAEQALPAAPPPPDPTRWLIWILPAVALLLLGGMLMGTRGRIPQRRRTLLEIARLDESFDSRPEDRTAYEHRRAELIAQLGTAAQL